jgi:hypothetical protein
MEPHVNCFRSMPSITRETRTVTMLAAALLLGAVVTPASASEVYYACLKKNGKIDSLVGGEIPTCKPNETLVEWNQTGPEGPAGPEGPEGPAGADGADGADGSGGAGALWANVTSDGSTTAASAGITATRLKTGVYRVTFPEAVNSCATNISAAQFLGNGIIGINPSVIDPPDLSHMFFSVYVDLSTTNSLVIGERNPSGALVDGPFSMTVICE